MIPTEIILSLIPLGGVSVWFWYDKKRQDSENRIRDDVIKEIRGELKTLNEIVVQHKSIHITESRSRQIADEMVTRVEKEIAETKGMVQTMMTQVSQLAVSLQTHTAVQKALREQQQAQHKD